MKFDNGENNLSRGAAAARAKDEVKTQNTTFGEAKLWALREITKDTQSNGLWARRARGLLATLLRHAELQQN